MRARRVLSSWAALAGILVIATSSPCGAQPTATGTAFTYQGRLAQSGGLAEGNFDLRFILFDTEIGGAQVGPIVLLEDVSVSGGLFSVELDFEAGAFGAEARWVEVAVRPGSETGPHSTLMPRQRITPAPQAIHADLLDGMDSADFAASVHDHDARYFTETELITSGGGGQVHFDNLLGVPPMIGDFHSLDASDGDPVDAVFVDAEGNTGFGTTAPMAGLHAAKAGLGFVDPQPLAEVFDGDGTFSLLNGANSVFVLGTTAYVASFTDSSLTIIDVSDPTNPTPLAEIFDGDGTFSLLNGANSVFVSGTTAYVASQIDDSLTIIDVSDPMNPALLAEVFDGDGTFGRLDAAISVFVSGTTAFVASAIDDSLTIIDVSNPMNPALLSEIFDGDGTFSRLDGAVSVFVSGTTAYVASFLDDSLTIIDVTDPTNPALLAEVSDNDPTFGFLDGAASVFVSGTTAYVASINDDSLTIIDVSDPMNPALLSEVFDGDGTFSRLDAAFSVFVSGTTAYVASAADNSLTIIDVSNPMNPALLAEVFDGDGTFGKLLSPRSVFVSGTTAYVASISDDSLTILDVGARPLYFEVGGDTLISGGTGSVRLTIEADTDNTGDLASIAMRQNGGATRATLGFSLGTADFQVAAGSASGSDILLMPQENVGIRTTNPTNPLEVGTDTTNGNGAHVTAGGVWTNGSDRNSKTGFMPIDPQAILERLATLPVTEWRYLGEPAGVRHVGPMAQDFMAAFGLGASDRHIGTIDADGIALAAIQGLRDLVLHENAALRSQNADLRRQYAQLATRLAEIEAALARPNVAADSTPR